MKFGEVKVTTKILKSNPRGRFFYLNLYSKKALRLGTHSKNGQPRVSDDPIFGSSTHVMINPMTPESNLWIFISLMSSHFATQSHQ